MDRGDGKPVGRGLGQDSSPVTACAPAWERVLDTAQRDIFLDEQAARRHLEALRWPDGACCPHCLRRDGVCALRGRSSETGLYFCGPCRRKFTVRVGTVCERSHVPLNKWLLAAHLMANAEQNLTVNRLSRLIGIQYRSAGFVAERICGALRVPRPKTLVGPTMDGDPQPSATEAPRQTAADRRRDQVLCRLLRMPYRPHRARQPAAGAGRSAAGDKGAAQVPAVSGTR